MSIVSVSLWAGAPQEGHTEFRNCSWYFSGDSPVGRNWASSGRSTGRSSSGAGTTPQPSQYSIGMGVPQYRWREISQSRSL